jgi:hypothetical protein
VITSSTDAAIRGVSKKFGEWYPKTNKTEDTIKLTLFAFKIIAILHNTLLVTFIKLMETISKGLFRNKLQNRCHRYLDCHHGKACAFHDALQVAKQKEVRRRQITGVQENNYAILSQEFVDTEWYSPSAPRLKNSHQRSKVKTTLIAFFDSDGIINKEFVPVGQTVNSAF